MKLPKPKLPRPMRALRWRRGLFGVATTAGLLVNAQQVQVPVGGANRLLLIGCAVIAAWALRSLARGWRADLAWLLPIQLLVEPSLALPGGSQWLLSVIPFAVLAREREARRLAQLSLAVGTLLLIGLNILAEPQLYGAATRVGFRVDALLGLPERGLGPRLTPLWMAVAALGWTRLLSGSVRSGLTWIVVAGVAVALHSAVAANPIAALAPLAILGLAWSSPFELPQRRHANVLPIVAGTGAVACAALLASALPLDTSARPAAAIGVLETTAVGFERPDSTWRRSSGLPVFGAWLDEAAAAGIQTETIPRSLPQDQLASLDALLTINHHEELTPDAQARLEDWISAGGTLLVLCDHTDVRGQMEPTNAMLAEYGIQLRFDSAMPIDAQRLWTGSIRTLRHPLLWDIEHPWELGFSIGASLDVEHPAYPLAVGEWSYSDTGSRDPDAGANLGDMRWNPNERLGGITLAAEARAGDGRVIVLGDTSVLQDGAQLHAGETRNRLLQGLASAPSPRGILPVLALIAAFTALSLLVMRPVAPLTLGLIASIGVLALGTPETAAVRADRFVPEVLLDGSHGKLGRVRRKSGLNVQGLHSAFSRKRLNAVPGHILDPADGRQLVVILAPETNHSEAELAELRRFVEAGGHIWITASRQDAESAPALFHEFGITFGPEPYGRLTDATLVSDPTSNIELSAAWPVHVDRAETVVEFDDRAFAVRKTIGEGQLVVIGDRKALLGRLLEDKRRVHTQNARLFDALVADLEMQP